MLDSYSAHFIRPPAFADAASRAMWVRLFDTFYTAPLDFRPRGDGVSCWDGRVCPCGQNAPLFVLVGLLFGPFHQTSCTRWCSVAGDVGASFRHFSPRPARFSAQRSRMLLLGWKGGSLWSERTAVCSCRTLTRPTFIRPRACARAASPALWVTLFGTLRPALLVFRPGGNGCCCWDGR